MGAVNSNKNGTTNHTKDGSVVRKCRVADRSASICFSLWNEQASAIVAGDILRLIKGYTALWKGAMVLYSGKYGKLEKVGEFTMLYSEMPDMSALDHDFLQLQQHQRRSPQPNSVERVAGGSSGERTGIPYIPPGNGRTSLAPPPGLGNWNGNNHIGNEPTPPPPDDPYGSNVGGSGGSMHERLPTPQQRPTHHDSKDSNNFCRGPLRTNNSTNEWPHPNQRLPANLQGNPTLDPRTATSRRR